MRMKLSRSHRFNGRLGRQGIFVLLSLAILSLGSAKAESPPVDLEQLADKSGLQAKLAAVKANLENKQVDLRGLDTQLSQRAATTENELEALRPRAERVQQQATESDNERERLQSAVNNWERACGRPGLDPGTYRDCATRREDLRRWNDAYQRRKQTIMDETIAVAREIQRKQDGIDNIKKRRSETAGQLEAISAGIEIERVRIDELKEIPADFLTDPKNREAISTMCTGLPTLEEQVECLKAVYDGAKSPLGSGASSGPSMQAGFLCSPQQWCCRHDFRVSPNVCTRCCAK